MSTWKEKLILRYYHSPFPHNSVQRKKLEFKSDALCYASILSNYNMKGFNLACFADRSVCLLCSFNCNADSNVLILNYFNCHVFP